jgi:hypothetical protein
MDDTKARANGHGYRLALAVALALTPAVAGIWSSPWFVTQDGPAHLYNAQILARSRDPGSPFRSVYLVRWQPLPNWAGHTLYLGLAAILPARAADRAATTITLLALAAATAWLRQRVAGGRQVVATATLAAILGLNVAWLFGFTGFLLGAALFPITLGVWWGGRDRMSGRRAVALAALIVLGYFCHPVSLGLTAFALLVLASLTPAESGWARRMGLTCLALSPLLPLGLIYRSLTRAGGAIAPEWQYLSRPLSPRAWFAQLGWVDPISLAAKAERPFGEGLSMVNGLAAPVAWLGLGLVLLIAATWRSRDPSRRAWIVLAAVVLICGFLGPDTIGKAHGHYLPQRVVQLGLVALVPWLGLDRPGRLAGLGRAAMVVALALQSLFVWDYGRESTRTVGRLIATAPEVGRSQRVAVVLLDVRGRFRANPLLHADCLLGVGTGNIIWGNYETNHYYFPVQLRDPDLSPPAALLEEIARLEGPANAEERARVWSGLIERYAAAIDVVVIDGSDPAIERITARRFVRSSSDGRVQVWVRGGGR